MAFLVLIELANLKTACLADFSQEPKASLPAGKNR
jgi:hypothetical protein